MYLMTDKRSYNDTMNNPYDKEAHSYKDPMSPRIESAKRHRKALEEEYPQARDVYDGFFLRLEELTTEGNHFFLGAEAIIGTALSFDGDKARILASDGTLLAQLTGTTAERLVAHATEGWTIKVLLSATFFRAQDKCAVADIAFVCWKPLTDELDTALIAFSRGIAERFASGNRAEVKLSQKQFIQVLESQGAWYLTPTTKRDSLEKGTVVFKDRRSGTERITAYALRHRSGCNILAILFWIALAAGIVALVWFFFFS